jgi:endonuclease/exonuclease/phosphatase family metal-dependent hydrolase
MVVGQGRHRRSVPTPAGPLKVVSWNIKFGVEIDAATRVLLDRDELRDADLVLLQEMDEAGTARIAETLGVDYVYGAPGVHVQTGRDFGNAILSRWPLGQPHVFELPHRAAVRGQPRVLVTTHLDLEGERVFVGSVHTEVASLSPPRRRRQFDEIAVAAGRRDDERLVIGGDFNTLTARGIRTLSGRLTSIGATRVSAGSGPTLSRRGQEFTLDHVFARGWEPVAAGVVAADEASDHRALWVDLADSAASG